MKALNSRSLSVGMSASFCLAILTCFVSNNLHPRFEHRQETIEQQLNIVEGKDYFIDGRNIYFGEFQNRVLPGLVLKNVQKFGMFRIGQWYLLLRFASGLLAFFLFWLLLTKSAAVPAKTALASMGLLAYALIFSYNHGWEHPTDFPDILFTIGYLWATLGQRHFAMVGLVLLGSFNRESSPFAGVIWFFVHGMTASWKINWRQASYAVGISLFALISVYAIRYSFGGSRAVVLQTRGIVWIGSMVTRSLQNPLHGWVTLLVCMLIPFAWCIGSNWPSLPHEWKRMTLAGTTVAIISGTFSVIQELRTLLPAITVLALTAAKAESMAPAISVKTSGRATELQSALKVKRKKAA